MFSGMGKSSDGEQAFLIAIGLKAAQRSATATLRS